MEKLIKQIIKGIGDNPDREGLLDTPQRVSKMYKELFRGYDLTQKPKITTFQNGKDGITYDQMILDSGRYYSFCEHHMLPFFGQYFFGYIPKSDGKLLGLSKVARIVDFHSAKLQIQERLVKEIVDDLWDALEGQCLGMGLIMKGTHLCKSMRGVKKEGVMTTIMLKGVFQEQKIKEEFLSIVK